MPKWNEAPVVNNGSKWSDAPVVNETGTRTEEAMRQTGFTARRQNPMDLSFGQRFLNDAKILGRYAVQAGRGAIEGVANNLVAPFANPAGYVANAVVPGDPFSTNIGADVSRQLTEAGVPEPEFASEQAVRNFADYGVGVFGGGAAGNAVAGRIGATPAPVNAPRQPRGVPRANTAPARTLAREGVTLDRSQATGGRFSQMLRSAVTNHPFTASRQAEFAGAQQREFNRAVLRSIGSSADEATQSVMREARNRIGRVFDSIGRHGTNFDDSLIDDVARIIDDARATVPDSEIAPLLRNIDDLLSAVDDAGRINGEVFTRVRSRLSNLSRRPGIGQVASDLEEVLMASLERTYPGQREILRNAIDQYRNLRIIAGAVDKGATGNISPLRLSNAIATQRNQNMSVFGLGGDQELVNLAQAGRSVLPQALPDSGTIPRGMMQAPIRAIATAPVYRGVQNWLLRQPQTLPPRSGVLRPEVVGAGASALSRQGSGTSDRR